ncbi:novel acetylcholine receptor chaperone-like [Uloborus diversus]|uniref:novel acetylcholine receptor chaperone-like n=1 Tax=Uloborus diversus TaxID=327109 RepID=UPI002409B8E6|nr:novel acetylcholine receptor chaperone-like [Uloborus diversus]XP_054706467.1 novel acetylcholine receptor chaperone-like [Uloborus diversus]
MGSIVLTTLSIFLGLFFILVGSMKISPKINKEMHREIRRNFVQYAKVFPLTKTLGIKMPSKYFRVVVGWMEVLCGAVLIFIPGVVKQIANVVLLVLMLGAFYTHTILEDKFERTAPSIVFALMLGCRLIVYLQVRKKERKNAACQRESFRTDAIAGKDTKQD